MMQDGFLLIGNKRLKAMGAATPGLSPVILTCVGCGERVSQERLWADHNGVPFKAYYCNTCVARMGCQ